MSKQSIDWNIAALCITLLLCAASLVIALTVLEETSEYTINVISTGEVDVTDQELACIKFCSEKFSNAHNKLNDCYRQCDRIVGCE